MKIQSYQKQVDKWFIMTQWTHKWNSRHHVYVFFLLVFAIFAEKRSKIPRKLLEQEENLSLCYEKWQYSIIDFMKSMSNLSLFDRSKSRFQMGFSKYWRIYISNLNQVDNLPVYRQILNSGVSFENTEGGHLFCAPVKFPDYYQYANK